MPKIAGTCLCGSVKYSSDVEPVMTAVCHCKSCQRQTGTAFSIVVGMPEASLEVDGQENIGEFLGTGDSGGKVHRNFCRNCGSPLWSTCESISGVEFIKAGTLDDTSWLDPTAHVWCETMQPWVDISESVEKHSRNLS